MLFSQIDLRMIEEFRRFMLTVPQGGGKSGIVSQNTAAPPHFAIFKTDLKQAFIDGCLTVDLSAKVKGIQEKESRREYLTLDELRTLASTPCDRPIMKRAALFSAMTVLRHCDIQKLKWSEMQQDGTQYRLHFTQQKTKGVEYMPISEQAYKLCGERLEPERLVFESFPDLPWIFRHVPRNENINLNLILLNYVLDTGTCVEIGRCAVACHERGIDRLCRSFRRAA